MEGGAGRSGLGAGPPPARNRPLIKVNTLAAEKKLASACSCRGTNRNPAETRPAFGSACPFPPHARKEGRKRDRPGRGTRSGARPSAVKRFVRSGSSEDAERRGPPPRRPLKHNLPTGSSGSSGSFRLFALKHTIVFFADLALSFFFRKNWDRLFYWENCFSPRQGDEVPPLTSLPPPLKNTSRGRLLPGRPKTCVPSASPLADLVGGGGGGG